MAWSMDTRRRSRCTRRRPPAAIRPRWWHSPRRRCRRCASTSKWLRACKRRCEDLAGPAPLPSSAGMLKTLFTSVAAGAVASAAAAAPVGTPAKGESVAWDITEGLTTEIGPRLDGTPREAAARDWAVRKLSALGFANVRIEPFTVRGFVRGDDRAKLTAPVPQPLAIT